MSEKLIDNGELKIDNDLSEWKEVKLEDFAEINPTERLPKGTLAKKIAMEVLQPFTKKISSFSVEEYKGGVKFKNGDTIMARITPSLENGKTSFVDILDENEIGFGSTEFIALREKENVSDKHFIYYLTTSPIIRNTAIKSMTGSSGRQRVQTDVVKEHLFDAPPLPEQKAIAEVLSSLDDKIDLLHRQNLTLEQMAETLFRQWFVEEAKEDWEETISEIPIDIIDGDRGKNYPKSVDFFDEEYCLFLSAKNVTTDGFDFSQKQFITKEKDSQLRKGKLMRGDIVLTTRGTVGNFSFYDDTISFDNIRINSGMIILRSKKYDPVLFYNIFKSDYFKKNLSEFISGSAQPQIPIRDFREIMIPFPTEVVINKYLELIKPLYSKLFKCNKQICTLEKMRDTLLPKLMSGEIKVIENLKD